MSVDILEIDSQIRRFLCNENSNIYNSIDNRIQQIDRLLKDSVNTITKTKLSQSKHFLYTYSTRMFNNSILFFYILDTIQYIDKYKQIISVPMKVNFMGKQTNTYNNKDKHTIINRYVNISNGYIRNLNIPIELSVCKQIESTVSCHNCKSSDITVKDYDFYICNNCFSILYNTVVNTSYTDSNRVNINTRYTYIRRTHFKDCIMQFQGKQNITIPKQVYKSLENELNNHYLLVGTKNTSKEIRFEKITKKHISIFLKELGYSKHYENINLIHYNMTGKKPHDISHLEEILLHDFDILTELYDKRFGNSSRRNFINIHYVLYQLLRRHNYKIDVDDKIIIKTVERKYFYDEICKKLFEELGWNHYPYY